MITLNLLIVLAVNAALMAALYLAVTRSLTRSFETGLDRVAVSLQDRERALSRRFGQQVSRAEVSTRTLASEHDNEDVLVLTKSMEVKRERDLDDVLVLTKAMEVEQERDSDDILELTESMEVEQVGRRAGRCAESSRRSHPVRPSTSVRRQRRLALVGHATSVPNRMPVSRPARRSRLHSVSAWSSTSPSARMRQLANPQPATAESWQSGGSRPAHVSAMRSRWLPSAIHSHPRPKAVAAAMAS